jgi:hypothetical protein
MFLNERGLNESELLLLNWAFEFLMPEITSF